MANGKTDKGETHFSFKILWENRNSECYFKIFWHSKDVRVYTSIIALEILVQKEVLDNK